MSPVWSTGACSGPGSPSDTDSTAARAFELSSAGSRLAIARRVELRRLDDPLAPASTGFDQLGGLNVNWALDIGRVDQDVARRA